MLLVSPITWDHYLVLALPALAFSWRDLRQHPMLNIFFLITLVFFSVCLGDLQLLLKQSKPLDAFMVLFIQSLYSASQLMHFLFC